MRVLTLGATGFLSGAVVREAAARGHEVVGLSRTPGDLPAGVRAVHADRDDVDSLRTALVDVPRPDAVVDTCGYSVAGALAAAEVLGDVPAYAYVSSVSAYRDWPPGPVRDESDPTFGPDADVGEYGPMKAESERVLRAALDDRVLLARAGLIIGPGDRTRRLTSWIHRFATEERVAVPEHDVPVAFVDVRDLAGWLLDMVERGVGGPVTATGPAGMTTFHGMLEACRAAVAAEGGDPAEAVPVPEAALLEAGVEPWRDLPFWLPDDVARTAWDVATGRARELGLPSRPVEESVADAWRWVLRTGFEHPPLDERLHPERLLTRS
ncbi:NAD-dependent epimerase/dehydratase family protein [Actinotalea ferrariae]|uniref:NAD-dependent epimerase/dehydratase family protein n=1 Tax=Actinotalea ferrariae TaxID=1386098 RepID=UPI001C8B3350|nr:NAD-dependent epimerase/dehydratase family protein [Actinotalea ferrariae]MBX9246173.1 NAD-dependent epimerase/dehydratase family protein [Actinotalea ferrariae]